MLVFGFENKVNCFVHLPKCSGKYIEKNINSLQTEFSKRYWGEDIETTRKFGYNEYIDRAHIPLPIFQKYFFKEPIDDYLIFTRCPYERLVSAYLYRCKWDDTFRASKRGFRSFCKHVLKNSNLYPESFNRFGFGVHYLAQTFFFENLIKSLDCRKNIHIYKIEEYDDWASNCPIKFTNFIKPSSKLDFYDKKSVAIVKEKYRLDFEVLAYEKEFPL